MLPLWPEKIYIGLFPGYCWLQRGANGEIKITPSLIEQNGLALLDHLQQLLGGLEPALRKGTRIRVVVSDTFSSIVTLPWQEQLNRQEEIESYAKICFDRQGITIGDDSVLHAEFRHFGGTGLAYTLSSSWVQSLVDFFRTKEYRLEAVLPLSAAAYFRHATAKNSEFNLLLLRESYRISALVWNKTGLSSHDVEVFTRSPEDAQHRLLQRVSATHGKINQISAWSLDPENKPIDVEALVKRFDGIRAVNLNKATWV